MERKICRSGTVNSNTVNSKIDLIRYCEIFFYHFPNISCLKCTVNLNFHLIRSKTLLTNDFGINRSRPVSLFTRTDRPFPHSSILIWAKKDPSFLHYHFENGNFQFPGMWGDPGKFCK